MLLCTKKRSADLCMMQIFTNFALNSIIPNPLF